MFNSFRILKKYLGRVKQDTLKGIVSPPDCTCVCLHRTKKKEGGEGVPESHILTAGLLLLLWSSSFDNRAGIKQQGGGIRLRDKTAGAGCLAADLIVHLSLHRHPACFCSPFFSEDHHLQVVFLKSWNSPILDCHFATAVSCSFFFFWMHLPWRGCRDGGLHEELPLSAVRLQEEG